MTTTISVDAKGHTITVQSVKVSAWGATTIDDTKILSLLVDSGGSFERTLYAYLGDPVSGPTKSTTTIVDDTVTAVFYLNGGDPSVDEDDRTNTRFKDVHVSESAEVAICNAGIFIDGSLDSLGIVGGSTIPNNSTVAKPRPICGWSDEPPLLSIQRQSTVDVGVFAGCGYAITDVTITIEDDSLNTASASATLGKRDRVGAYGPMAMPIWRASVDCSGLNDGPCTISFVATTEAGSTFDSSAFGLADLEFVLDKDASELLPTVYVDATSTLAVTGTCSVTVGTIIEGATSGAKAIVDQDATISGSGNIQVVMRTTTSFSAGETINNLTTGSATADGAETDNWNGTVANNDPNATHGSVADALAAGKTLRNNAGSPNDWSGITVRVKSKYAPVLINDGFGNTAIKNHRSIVEPYNQDEFHLIAEPVGTSSGNKDHRLWYVLFRDCVFHIVDSQDIAIALSTSDPAYFLTENARFVIDAGASGTLDKVIGNDNPQYHVGAYGDGWWPLTRSGSEAGVVCVILDAGVSGITTPQDYAYFDSTSGTEGNASISIEADHLIGLTSGTHGDFLQMVGSCQNIIFFGECKNVGYQGVFANDAVNTESVDGLWVQVFLTSTEDSAFDSTTINDSTGPGPIALHESVSNLLLEFSTSIRSPAIAATEVEDGFKFIPSNVQCDNVFIRNSVFSAVVASQGSYASQGPILPACIVNCHVVNTYAGGRNAVGTRGTLSATVDNYSDLFASPWTDGGVYPNDGVDWEALAGGPLDGRIKTDDIINQPQTINGVTPGFGGSVGAYAITAVPTVINRTPANGATGVLDSQTISLQFSENMATGSGTIELRRVSDDSVIDSIAAGNATTNFSDRTQVTLTGLNATGFTGAAYVYIPSGAFVSAATGLAFAGYTDNTGWNFTIGTTAVVRGTSTAKKMLLLFDNNSPLKRRL